MTSFIQLPFSCKTLRKYTQEFLPLTQGNYMIDMVDILPDLMLKNVGYELKDTFAFHGFFFNPLVSKPSVID